MQELKLIGLPEEWRQAAAELLPEVALTETANGTPVKVVRGKGLSLVGEGEGITLTAERTADFCRALSHLKRKLAGGADVREQYGLTSLGLMQDMSRNAVMSVPAVKRLLRQLALMGYDSMMLYTEDTYELPDYPYFGYMRGRYTLAEMREIDDYAYALGIEVIPCIQTLGHLERAFIWNAFSDFTDTKDILLVGDERTYTFIEEMLKTVSSAFRSRRINIGMDEAHDLGRGKYLDRNGYRCAHEIILEHLERVVRLCQKYGYAKPMMWSDMFFRMAFDHQYYVKEGEIPADIAAKIPKDVVLIYWDYYKKNAPYFEHMLRCHTKLDGVATAFASGAWRWSNFAPVNRFSVYYAGIQMAECKRQNVTDIFVTAWGDMGSEAPHMSTLPTLLYFAESAYCTEEPAAAQLETRSRDCFDIGYEEFLTIDRPNELPGICVTEQNPLNPCRYLLYNDLLEGLMDLHVDADTASDAYREHTAALRALAGHKKWGYMFENLANLCDLLTEKCDFSIRLRAAYKAGNKERMRALVDEIDVMVKKLDAFYQSFRRQWFVENKPFGFEVQDARLGGLRQRFLACADRVNDYLNGAVADIPELEQEQLPFKSFIKDEMPYINGPSWGKLISPCITS